MNTEHDEGDVDEPDAEAEDDKVPGLVDGPDAGEESDDEWGQNAPHGPKDAGDAVAATPPRASRPGPVEDHW